MSAFVRFKKDVTLALALAAGASATDAARQAGLSDRTIRRKLARPEFRRLVAELRGELIARALGRLADNMTRAADALAGLLDTDDPRLRLRTARAVLSVGLRLHDSVDLSERVRELEEELDPKQGANP